VRTTNEAYGVIKSSAQLLREMLNIFCIQLMICFACKIGVTTTYMNTQYFLRQLIALHGYKIERTTTEVDTQYFLRRTRIQP